MKKRLSALAILSAATLGIGLAAQGAAASPQTQTPNGYIDMFMSGIPGPVTAFNWKQRALDYDSFVYNRNAPGAHPTIYTDTTHYNMTSNTYKMPTYYGDTRFTNDPSSDGNQEGLGQLASVVGASLVGVNKASQGGYNYVDMSRTFFHPELGVALNSPRPDPDGGSGSWWYTTLVNALYMMLGNKYASATDMTTIQRSIADKYYAAVVSIGGADADFTGQGYNFATMTKNLGGRNEGGDGATGSAAILLWAYEKFGDAKYLQGAKWSMDFLERSDGRLYYEILPVLGPYIAARMNAEFGTSYDVGRNLTSILDVNPTVRPTWGAMRQQWGGYDVGGLQGAIIDNGFGTGGYAFAMNSFAATFLAPTVKYDPRYANEVGKYLLYLNNSARLFYADQLPAANQTDGSRWLTAPDRVIAYESLKQELNGASPVATSDVTRSNFGGGDSDLGLYGGSWVGFLGSTVADTNVSAVKRIDLNALDFYGDATFPRYLYYNPTLYPATVQLPVTGAASLFDTVTDTLLTPSVSGTATVTIPPQSSRVVVVASANPVVARSGGKTTLNGVVAGWRSGTTDLAYGRPVTASSTVNGNLPSYLTDGTTNRRWESQTADPQWVSVDLGSNMTVDSTVLKWEVASAKSFTVRVSTDNTNWTPVYSTTNGPGGFQTVNFAPVTARYLRVDMTQRNTGYAYSMYDLEVYRHDLAASKPVAVTSTQNDNLGSYLTDGTTATRWESATADPQGVVVDLGQSTSVGRLVLKWEAASAKTFQVQLSNDGTNYSTVYSTSAGPGGVQTITFGPVIARYVYLNMTQRNTGYAYSMYDLEAYAQ